MSKITTEQMTDFFIKRWPNTQNSYHFFTELRLGTGWANDQRADGYLLELWPSKNFERTCFEYKISRADFLKEIKNPQKRQSSKSYSDYFVIVTANDIVKDKSEIPQDCGWYVFNGKGLEIKIKPPRLPPLSMADWAFICGLVRHSRRDGKEMGVPISPPPQPEN